MTRSSISPATSCCPAWPSRTPTWTRRSPPGGPRPGSGDLAAAIATWIGLRGQLTEADFAARARRAALSYLASGATAIRTHTDVGAEIGLIAFRALCDVRAELAGTVDIEIVAAANSPVTGLAA